MTASFIRKITSTRRIQIDRDVIEKEQLNKGDIIEVWIKKYKPGVTDG